MNHRTVLLTLICFLISMSVWASVKVGQQAPAFTLKSSAAHSISLLDFSDKVVVLEWTNHECPYVKKHYRSNNMQALQKKYKDQGVVWLSIISSAPGKQGYVGASEALQLTKARNAAPHSVLLDPEGTVGKLYGATNTPQMFVIHKGKIEYMGAIDSIRSADISDVPKAKNYVAAALDEVMSGKPVSVSSSKPYGCSVKYKGGWW